MPLVLGLLPYFRRCGVLAANLSVVCGIAAFFVIESFSWIPHLAKLESFSWIATVPCLKDISAAPLSYSLFFPVVTSLVIFWLFSWGPERQSKIGGTLEDLGQDKKNSVSEESL